MHAIVSQFRSPSPDILLTSDEPLMPGLAGFKITPVASIRLQPILWNAAHTREPECAYRQTISARETKGFAPDVGGLV